MRIHRVDICSACEEELEPTATCSHTCRIVERRLVFLIRRVNSFSAVEEKVNVSSVPRGAA
jgi:hypothetical protein